MGMILIIFQPLSASVKNNTIKTKRGQTLITLLIFILVLITVAMTSVSIIISNAQVTTGTGQSIEAYYAAEAGIENASLQLLRNQDYTGETIQVSPSATAIVTVTNNGQYTVLSKGMSGGFTRVIQAKLDYTNNVLTIISWQQLFQ